MGKFWQSFKLILASVLLVLLPCSCEKRGEAAVLKVKVNGSGTATLTLQKNEVVEISASSDNQLVVSYASANQPVPSGDAATASISESEVSANSGAGQEPGSTAYLDSSLILGIALIIAGVFIFLAKRQAVKVLKLNPAANIVFVIMEVIPKGFGQALAILGGIIIITPWYLQEYGWIIGWSSAIIIITFLGKYIYNLLKKKKDYHGADS